MMKVLFGVLFLLCAGYIFAQGVKVDKKEYARRINTIQTNITRYFFDSAATYYREFDKPESSDKKWSYLWPLCGLIQAANEVEAVQGKEGYMRSVLETIYAYNDNAKPLPAYNSYIINEGKEARFYDDNQWIGIACMEAFSRTKDSVYVKEGIKTYRFMLTGYDTVSGGGLYWKEGDFTTKNTCSNGPGILLALQLYKTTHEKKYLDTALLLYHWTNKKLLSPEGVYYDHVMLPSGKIDNRLYTYNAGTMLQANVMLYEILKDNSYLQMAKEIAASAYKNFYKNDRWPENYWFNAVLLRGYWQLRRYEKNNAYINSFASDMERIWQHERNTENLIGQHKKRNLLDQAALMEMYARLAL